MTSVQAEDWKEQHQTLLLSDELKKKPLKIDLCSADFDNFDNFSSESLTLDF